MHAAFEDGVIIGGAGAFTFDFAVPGGSLPGAGVRVVGVVLAAGRRQSHIRSRLRGAGNSPPCAVVETSSKWMFVGNV